MFLTTIFALMVIFAAIIAVIIAGTIGGAALVIFGDLIIFIAIMWMIIKLIFRNKK